MGFFVLSRQSERLFRNFYAALCVYKDGSSGAKSCPEPPGRGGGGIQSPGSEWRRSKFGGVVLPLVCTGATECDASKILSRLLQRCRMVDSCSTSSSSPTAQNSTLQNGSNEPKSTLFYSLPLAFSGTDFFFFHSLTSCSLNPPSSVGVSCFALLLPHGAAHADPRREGGGEELNAHLLPKIVYDRGRLLFLSVQ